MNSHTSTDNQNVSTLFRTSYYGETPPQTNTCRLTEHQSTTPPQLMRKREQLHKHKQADISTSDISTSGRCFNILENIVNHAAFTYCIHLGVLLPHQSLAHTKQTLLATHILLPLNIRLEKNNFASPEYNSSCIS
jgi:hypothetical protein